MNEQSILHVLVVIVATDAKINDLKITEVLLFAADIKKCSFSKSING